MLPAEPTGAEGVRDGRRGVPHEQRALQHQGHLLDEPAGPELPVGGVDQVALQGRRRPLGVPGVDHRLRHHLGAALRAATGPEEATPDPADDEHALVDIVVAGRKEIEPLLEPREDHPRRHRPRAGRRKLDRKRQIVEPAAQRSHRLVTADIHPDRPRALDEGGLTGRITADTTFEEGDFRATFFGGDRPAQVEQHVQTLTQDLGVEVDEVPDLALRYVLAHPAVSTVIAGMRTVRNVERNAATSDRGDLPEEQLAALKRHRWERNWYRD